MLSDPAASRALLVGVAEYISLDSLPAVANNLAGMRDALTDPAIWGLSPENCVLLRQPDTADAVLDSLQQAAAAATDTLVFYYAGHGLIDPGNDDELHLALPGSDMERAFRTAVPYSWVRREIQAARVRRKVVILDCCYSGRALGRWMSGEAELAERLDIDGTCVLTATARTRKALAPPGERFTAFTGELIDVFTGGVPDGPDLLDMDTLYRHLTVRLRGKSLPVPQRGQLDRGGDIVLARNQAATRQATAPVSADEPIHDRAAANEPTSGVPQRSAWRQSIDTSRQPLVRGLSTPVWTAWTARRLGRISLLSLLAWTALAAWLPWARGPVWWLAISGAAGFISLLLSRLVLREPGSTDDLGILLWLFFVFCTVVLYCVAVFVFTASWATRWWGTGTLLFLALIVSMNIYEKRQRARMPRLNESLGRQNAVAEAARIRRWLRAAGPDSAGSDLLEPLTVIPAVRLAALSDECFPLLAVSGSRVVLLAFTNWPPGVYTRNAGTVTEIRRNGNYFQTAAHDLSSIVARAKEWQEKVPDAIFRVVVVVRPSTSSRGGGITLQIPSPVGREILAFATADTFEDLAGEFLAEDAYVLRIPVLEKLI